MNPILVSRSAKPFGYLDDIIGIAGRRHCSAPPNGLELRVHFQVIPLVA
jgi:hypothetical protein